MDRQAKKELLRRKQLAKFRFKCLCRFVILNAYWLSAIEDTATGSDPRRYINIIVRRSGKNGILTLKEKSIFNKPKQDRTPEEKEQLKVLIDSLKCFELIPWNIRDHLVEICRFLYCAPQRVILREGHHSSALYFVLDGEINVSKRGYSAEVGKVIDDVQYALVPGDFFGVDGLIFGNRRAVTCTAAIYTELLYIYKDELSDELRRCLKILWQQIRASLKRSDYYFGHFTDQQIIECCTFSKIRQYELDAVVYDENVNKQKTSFFLLSGQCSVLQYLKVKKRNPVLNFRRNFASFGSKLYYNVYFSVPLHREMVSTNGRTEMLDNVFVDIGTLSAGSIFGLGEKMTDRSIVAKNVVQCLEIPRFWLMQRSQNIGNVWQRTKIFYNATIPSRELVFDDFVRSFRWSQYKDRKITEIFRLKSKL